MEKKGIAEKYRATSYKSLKRKISSLSDILDNAYGKSYCQISNPTLIGNVVNLGIDNANKRKSRDVTHSFGMKLRALMLGKEVEITFCDVQRTKKKYKFTDEERLSFVLFGILYKTFEGQLKPSKPFSYRRFSWLTLCGCQVRNKKIYKKISPTRVSVGSEPI